MNQPRVFVLMLRVDDRATEVVKRVLAESQVSFQSTELNSPYASKLPANAPEWKRFREQIEHYLRVCERVVFVVGYAGPAQPPDALLQRLTSLMSARERDGRAVSRLKLGGKLPRSLGPEAPGQETISKRDERAVERFIKEAIFGPLMGGGVKATHAKPPATGGTEFLGRGGGEVSDKSISPGGLIRDVHEMLTADDEPRESTAPAGAEPPEPDELLCSVYSPRLAAPGDEILVQAFAHLEGQEAEVAATAAAADPSAAKVGARPLDEKVSEGERLGFHLTLRGAEIDMPDQEFVWKREPLSAQFGVYFPDTSQPRDAVGTVIVTKSGVPVGHIKFTLRVVTREEKAGAAAADAERQGEYSRYRKAFISYASKDRERVLPRVQALAAAHIDVFQDFVELEPGERWERGLYKHIDECDAFFLFWSQAARDSQWVRKEAGYAHDRQEGQEDRPPEIIPIIIEGPPPVAPPEELNFLHFNDKYIYLLKGVEAEAEARRSEKK